MEGNLLWRQRVARGNDAGTILWSVACSPDGRQLVLGVGCCVLLVDADSGETLQTLAGHKGNVNAVAFASDGKRFASGGVDKQIILWTAAGELLRRCTHSGSVQALAFNPRTHLLASGTTDELGLWHEDGSNSTVLGTSANFLGSRVAAGTSRSSNNFGDTTASLTNAIAVTLGLASNTSELRTSTSSSSVLRCGRVRVSSRICTLSWDDDGRRLALGHYNGSLVVRDEEGSKLWSQQLGAAVWVASWCPSRQGVTAGSTDETGQQGSLLVACTFEPRVWLFSPDEGKASTSVSLACDPLSIAFFPTGDYFVIASVDGSLTLWSAKGTFLQSLVLSGEQPEATACCVHPSDQRIAFTSRQGDVAVAHMRLPVVHGLHREIYARRTALGEVTVRNLITDKMATLHFDELVQKIAVYRRLLAVQLEGCIVVSETHADTSGTLEYQEILRLQGSFQCSLMLLTAQAVVLCKGTTLQLHEFQGSIQRQWTLRASIRYVRVVGGAPGAEVLLAGLRNGEAVYVYVHQELPLPLLQHPVGIICVDVSAERGKLAIIDETKELCVYDLASKRRMYSHQGCTSAAWNLSADDLLAVSGRNALTIRAGSLTPYQFSCQGIVVGFLGSYAFCLHCQEMRRVEVKHTPAVQQLMKKGNLKGAYAVACLGATREDWRQLGFECLRRGDLQFARKAFQRQGDYKSISMLNQVQEELQTLHLPIELQRHVCRAYAYASFRDFEAAAEEWAKAGLPQRSSEMFADLRRWAEARRWAAFAAESCSGSSAQAAKVATAETPAEALERTPAEAQHNAAIEHSEGSGGKLRQTEATYNPALEKELREAAALYLAAGQVERACRAYAKIGAVHSLIETVRSYGRCTREELSDQQRQAKQAKSENSPGSESPKDHDVSAALRYAARAFENSGHANFAQEALLYLGDLKGYLALLTRAGRWDEALARAEQEPQLLNQVLVPWGHNLLLRDQPESAAAAFRRAGREDLALRVENALLHNAVSQQLFAQAAAQSWALARAFAHMIDRGVEERCHSTSGLPCGVTTTISQGSPRGKDSHEAISPANLPGSVCRFLVCYFRRLSEIYAVYFVLMRHASSTPPRADMPAHAVLRACAFLWSHALAPRAQPVDITLAASVIRDESASPADDCGAPFTARRSGFGTGAPPCWRLLPWWHEAQAAMELLEVQKCLRLCGVQVSRRVKGIRASLVLRLMAEAAFQLCDLETAAAACRELRLLALSGPELRERSILELKVKAARASAPAGDPEAANFCKAVCGLCGDAVRLLTSEAVPVGADLSCGNCGCPISVEFGTFAPIKAVECCQRETTGLAAAPSEAASSLPAADDSSPEELFLTAARAHLRRLQPSPLSASERHSAGPLDFQPPAVSPGLLHQQPRGTVLRRTNIYLDGSSGSSVLRLLELPHANTERALDGAAPRGPEALYREADMLVICGTCQHLFIEPPAHGQLLPGNPCICCAAKSPRIPALPYAALR